MQLKPLKKRLGKQKLITRNERITARKSGTQRTQSKDILYHKMTKTIQKEIKDFIFND